MNEFNPKSPLEYALGKFVEEGSEVIQAVQKITNFGLASRYRDGTANLTKLQQEITDWIGALEQVNLELAIWGYHPLVITDIRNIRQKMIKIHKFAAYSRHQGLLDGPLRMPPPSSPFYFEPDEVPSMDFGAHEIIRPGR